MTGDDRARSRICLVTETYPPEINGVAMTLARLAEGLRKRGHAVSVVRPRQPGDADSTGTTRDPAVLLVQGMVVPGYPAVRLGLPAARRLEERWTHRRPDVVYVATEGPLGWSAVAVARRLGVPVWSGFHTNFPEYARYYAARWIVPVVFRLLRRFHNHTDGTIVATEELRRRLSSAGFRNVCILGRGVDCELFSPRRRSRELRTAWGAADRDIVALSVGRLAAEKNLPLALSAFRALRRAQSTARCVIVGDGPLRKSLERANPDVIFCGMLGGERLATHYASADLFLFPSETETFGNVTLEAMASGLTVAAYDYASAGMHIRRSESGVLVARGDARAYVDEVAALVQTPEVLSRMGARARAHAVSLDWRAVVERFEILLTSSVFDRPAGAFAVAPAGVTE